MNIRRQVTFWIATLVVFVIVLWLLGDVLLPFVAGIALAYFLDPIADRLERLGLPRWAATSVILLAFLMVLVVGVLLLLPVLGDQLESLRERVPAFIASIKRIIADDRAGMVRAPRRQPVPGHRAHACRPRRGRAPPMSRRCSPRCGREAGRCSASSACWWSPPSSPSTCCSTGTAWSPRSTAGCPATMPRRSGFSPARSTARSPGSCAGRRRCACCSGLFYGIALSLVGLNFGFLIGLTSGLVSFIPFVGSIFGFIVSVGVALVQTWPEWQLPVIVAVIFAVGQFIEGNILSPRLVGSSVGLHPVWLMLALLVAGSLFGFLGLLVAVPVAAAIGVLTRFALGPIPRKPALQRDDAPSRRGHRASC